MVGKNEIIHEMQQYQWYHTVDLGQGVITPGQYDHRPLLHHYGLPDNLLGKTVVDIGPAHGFFAFEFEKRSAERVATVELPRWSDHDGSAKLKAGFTEDNVDEANEGYLHDALSFAIKARGSKVEQLFYNIYDIGPETTGQFDVAFCGSLLIHLTDPLRALYAIHSVTREYAIITTPIDLDRFGRKPRALFHGTANGQAFWAPNMLCFERWALAAGFKRVERVSTFTLKSLDGLFNIPHGTIKAFVD
jgi:tRNA (mo5U34)-methyltransferase